MSYNPQSCGSCDWESVGELKGQVWLSAELVLRFCGEPVISSKEQKANEIKAFLELGVPDALGCGPSLLTECV